MANNREIDIRFKADTQDFNNGINKANSNMKNLTSELKLNASQLKSNAGDVSLLEQRQSLLTQKLNESRDKVDLTNQKLQQAKALYGEDSEEVKKLERALNEAKTQEQGIQNEISRVNDELNNQKYSLEDVSAKFQAFGEGMESAGKKATIITAAVAGIGAGAVKSAMELDEGYDTVITKTGATGEALSELQDNVDNVFKSMPIEAETAGVAIGEVNTRFQETGERLEELSTSFIQFSEINNTDLNSSIDNVDAIMTKFNVDTEHTEDVLGLMTKAGQDTGISMETLQGTLTSNGATLKELGLGITESVNLLAQMEANGVDTSTAMAGLKKAQQQATKEGISLSEALSDTIDDIVSATDETEALQIATDLFGKKGAAEMTQAIREGRFSIDDLSTSLSDYGNVVQNTFESTLSPWNQAKTSMNQLKVAGSDLAGTVLNELSPVIESASEKVEGFANWFQTLDDQEQMQIVTIAGVAAAIGPVLITIGKVSQGISSITSLMGAARTAMAASTAAKVADTAATTAETAATSGATVAQTGLNMAFLACPLTWIIVGIVALVASFVVLWNKCEGFRNFFIGMWEGIKEGFGAAKDFVVNGVTSLGEKFNSAKDKVGNAVEGMKSKFSDLKNGAKEKMSVVADYAKQYMTSVKDTYEEAGGGIQGAVAVAMKVTEDKFKAGYNVINTLTKGKLDELKNSAVEKFNAVKDGATAKLQEMRQNVKTNMSAVKNEFDSAGGGIKGAAAATMKMAEIEFKNGFNLLNTLTKGKLGDVTTGAKEKLDGLKSKFTDAVSKIKDIFNFKIPTPSIKMPKIEVTWKNEGSLAKAAKFLGMPGLPKFDIKWNATGAIFRRPTIIGYANGSWQGVGERGDEAVLPIDTLEDWIGNKMMEFLGSVPQIDYDKLGQIVIDGVKSHESVITLNGREVGRMNREVSRL